MHSKRKSVESKRESHYDTLEVASTATPEEIKKSYKSLALKYHPDKSSDPNAATQMQHLNEAYKVLSNETQRRKYDLLFEAGGDAADLSDESFEYEDEVIVEVPDEFLHKRWKQFLMGWAAMHFCDWLLTISLLWLVAYFIPVYLFLNLDIEKQTKAIIFGISTVFNIAASYLFSAFGVTFAADFLALLACHLLLSVNNVQIDISLVVFIFQLGVNYFLRSRYAVGWLFFASHLILLSSCVLGLQFLHFYHNGRRLFYKESRFLKLYSKICEYTYGKSILILIASVLLLVAKTLIVGWRLEWCIIGGFAVFNVGELLLFLHLKQALSVALAWGIPTLLIYVLTPDFLLPRVIAIGLWLSLLHTLRIIAYLAETPVPEDGVVEPTVPFATVLLLKSHATKFLFGLVLMVVDVFVIPISSGRTVNVLGLVSLVACIYYLLSWHTLRLHSNIIFEATIRIPGTLIIGYLASLKEKLSAFDESYMKEEQPEEARGKTGKQKNKAKGKPQHPPHSPGQGQNQAQQKRGRKK